eukprot:gene7528-8364_t
MGRKKKKVKPNAEQKPTQSVLSESKNDRSDPSCEREGKQGESTSISFRVKIWPENEVLKIDRPSVEIKEALNAEYNKQNNCNDGLSFHGIKFLTGNEFEVIVEQHGAQVSNNFVAAVEYLSQQRAFSFNNRTYQVLLNSCKVSEIKTKDALDLNVGGAVSIYPDSVSSEACQVPTEAYPAENNSGQVSNSAGDMLERDADVLSDPAGCQSLSVSDCASSESSEDLIINRLGLLVFHPSKDVDEEFLKLYFESPRAVGVSCEVADAKKIFNGAFLVTFTDSSVVSVLTNKQHKLKGQEVVVKAFDPESTFNKKAIIVSGLTEEIDKYTLELYFGNEKHGGGDIEESIQIENSRSEFKIIFEAEKAAENVLNYPLHKVRGTTLKVEPYQIDVETYVQKLITNNEDLKIMFHDMELEAIQSSQCEIQAVDNEEEQQSFPRQLKVQGLPEGVDEEVVQLFFEHERKTGGGDIKCIKLVNDTAVIEFEDESVIDRVLKKEKIELKGKVLTVSVLGSCSSEENERRSRSVVVTGNFFGKFNESKLEMFFEQHGGDIEEVFTRDTDAVIVFKDLHVAQEVLLKKKFSYKEFEMHVKKLENMPAAQTNAANETKETYINQRTIEIHGDIENINKEILMLYLENNRKSGGGPIETADLDANPPWVSFSDAQSANGVLSKSNHVLENKHFKVKRYQEEQFKENEIIVRNFSSRTTEDSIKLYIEKITSLEVSNVVFSHDRKSLLAELSSKIDWPRLMEKYRKKKQLDGSEIELAKVSLCKTLLISNIAKKTTKDGIQLTLEKLAGFDSIEETKFEEGVGFAVVEFSHAQAIDKLLKESITLDNAEWRIDEFNPSFETEYTWTIMNKALDEVKIEVDSRVLDFILKERKADICHKLDSEVYKKNEKYQENGEEKLKCHACFTPNRKLSNSKELFRQYYDAYTSCFVEFGDKIEEENAQVCDLVKQQKVGCSIDWEDKGIWITGEIASVKKIQSDAKNLIKALADERNRKAAVIERNFPLPSGRAELLDVTGYLRELERDFSVKIDRKDNELIIRGPETQFQNVEHGIMRKTMCAVDRTSEHSNGLCKNLSEEGRRDSAIKKLASMKIHLLFKANCTSNEIRFLSFDEETLLKGIEMFKKIYGDVTINVKNAEEKNLFGIVISGLGSSVEKAFVKLEELSSRIFKEDLILERPGVTKLFKSSSVGHSMRNIESQENVVIIEKSEDVSLHDFVDDEFVVIEPDSDGSKHGAARLVCSYRTQNGLTIGVHQGDITCQTVDAIVNPANTGLWLGGGVAGAILRAGGQNIQDECSAYVERHGMVEEGQAVATTAGRLRCKRMIHAVGPRWPSDNRRIGERELGRMKNDCEEKLFAAMKEILVICDEQELATVAVPAISSGIFGFPKDLCAKTLVDSALRYHNVNPRSTVTNIIFINNDDDTVKAFSKEFNERFRGSSDFVEQPVPKRKVTPRVSNDHARSMWSQRTKSIKSGSKVSHNQGQTNHGDQNIAPITTAHGISVEVVIGDLAKQQVDVIVNTAGGDLNLSKNPCAQAISNAAGKKLQDECDRFVQQNGRLGAWSFAPTFAYSLKCKFVLHAVCEKYDGVPGGQAEQNLKALIMKLLADAETSRGAKSIAIPALGTGILGFPRDTVATILMECIDAFGRQQSASATGAAASATSSLSKVKLVAFHSDHATIDAFKKAFQSINTASATAVPTEKEAKKEWRSATSLSTDLPDAEEIICLELGDVVLGVDQGDITSETSDAIVVIGNENFDFKGAVGNVIQKKEGSKFVNRAKKNRGYQTPGTTCLLHTINLPAKYIAHVCFPLLTSYEDLKTAVKDMLRTCDDKKLRSVSIPAIGTGVFNMTARESARLILSTFAEMCYSGSLKNIRQVRVIVYEEKMLSDFIEEFNRIYEDPEQYINDDKPGLLQWVKDKWKSFCMQIGTGSQSSRRKMSATAGASADGRFRFTPVEFMIYSADQSGIRKARKRLQQIVEEHIRPTETTIDVFKKISNDNLIAIKREAQKRDVMLEVEKNTGKITLTGYHEDTMEVLKHCHSFSYGKIQRNAEREKYENLRDYIQWFEVQKDGTRVSYDAELNFDIEQHYKEQDSVFEREMVSDEDKKCKFEFHLEKMNIINLETGDDSTIERKELNRVDTTDTSFKLPSHWDPMPRNASGLEQSYHVVDLPRNSKEFQDVMQKFQTSAQGQISNYYNIRRIQNPGLYQAYQAKKINMEKTGGASASNEKRLFHGTQPSTCDQIIHFGFNRSFAGRNATVYGEGVYFATASSYSIRYSSAVDHQGYRHMLLAKVLVGPFAQGVRGMKVAPTGFDSVTDNVTSPGMYVTFTDNQCYPEYELIFN